MRPQVGGVLAFLLLAAPSAARQAHVFIADPSNHVNAGTPSFSASTARLIFARRLGLSQFHSLSQEDIQGDAISALNAYGGAGDNLFGSESDLPSRSLVFVEGYEDHKDFLPENFDKTTMRFTIDSVPSPKDNDKLVQDLRQQHTFLASQQEATTMQALNIETLANGRAGTTEQVKSHLKQLLDSEANPIIVVMDPVSTGFFSKRSTGTWGSYKRQSDFFSGRPDITPESPVDPVEVDAVPEDEETLAAEAASRPASDYDWVDVQQDEGDGDSKNTTAPKGILPQCYTSESSCTKTTNNCSGHGSCKSKYKYNEGPKTVECFACVCEASIKGEGPSRSVTHWSGPACQKKDVSTQFWLLAGISVSLAVIISWGIGMLYTMGQEELPSVIGAGVALPKPK